MIATGDHGYLYRCAMPHPADQVPASAAVGWDGPFPGSDVAAGASPRPTGCVKADRTRRGLFPTGPNRSGIRRCSFHRTAAVIGRWAGRSEALPCERRPFPAGISAVPNKKRGSYPWETASFLIPNVPFLRSGPCPSPGSPGRRSSAGPCPPSHRWAWWRGPPSGGSTGRGTRSFPW